MWTLEWEFLIYTNFICELTNFEVQNNTKDPDNEVLKLTALVFYSIWSPQAACGIANKPKDPIANIDESDVDDELAVVEYVEDIYKFYTEVIIFNTFLSLCWVCFVFLSFSWLSENFLM